MNSKTNRWTYLCLSILIVASAGCQSQEMQEVAEDKSSDNTAKHVDQNNGSARPEKISIGQQIQGSKSDLASRIGVAEESITVNNARSVQWSSGAVGCPKPGMSYTQALVPGIRLLLEANGTIYYYHGETGRSLFYCPAERAKAPAYGQGAEVI